MYPERKGKALQGTAVGYCILAEARWLVEQAMSLEAISNGKYQQRARCVEADIFPSSASR
jgi:hypothetical protein